MGFTKKQLEAKIVKLEAANKLLEENTPKFTEDSEEQMPKLPVEELLTKINGFEGAVAEVKHLKAKSKINPDHKLLARELKAKLGSVKAIIKSIQKDIC